MTHQNFQTNGASLEDCHTNFFALTELSGIKWRKLVWHDLGGCKATNDNSYFGDVNGPSTGNNDTRSGNLTEPLDDPVLHSYAKCLAADILCVWRRISTTKHSDSFDTSGPPPPLSLSTSKELWIFWYGEEPDLSMLLSPELNAPDCEQGSWESGLSYECRSLLFKALHNLIERCLLSRNFVRLGKWFVQPYDGPRKTDHSATHLSFSFAFFVHGESSVCASVDVRQHPPVRRLTRSHLQNAQSSSKGLKVILAPFGLAGVLTGQSFKFEPNSRFLEDWSKFYPIEESHNLIDNNVIEVIVGGVKMRYPACYVLVTDLDSRTEVTTHDEPSPLNERPGSGAPKLEPGGIQSQMLQTPPLSPVQINSRVPQPSVHPITLESQCSHSSRESVAGKVLPERVWQECFLESPTTHVCDFSGQWKFVDPLRCTACSCTRSHNSSSSNNAPLSYPRTQESAIPSVGTPHSVAPSPLPNPQSQPTSVPPADQTMPTLSPNPPLSTHSSSEKEKSTIEESPKDCATPSTTLTKQPQVHISKVEPETNIISNHVTLKRPILRTKDYEGALDEEDKTLEMLYDYSSLDAWYNYPVKKLKFDMDQRNTKFKNADIYSLHNSEKPVYNITNDSNSNVHIMVKQEIKEEITDESDVNCRSHGVKRPGDPYDFDDDRNAASSFSTEFTNGLGTELSTIKEEAKDSKKVAAINLFTNEGLQPSYRDLDQIFDNSDDTSSDEAQVQAQTPPGLSSQSYADDFKRIPSCTNIGILRPEELSEMFPTPPSLEHNPIASPCGQLDLSMCDFNDITTLRSKQEIYPSMGSPQEELIDDWSYVFKPPTILKVVGSSKYAPLNNLPSQNLPCVTVPANCQYKPSWVQHKENAIMHSPIGNSTVKGSKLNSNNAPPPLNSNPNSLDACKFDVNAQQFPPSPMIAQFRQPPPPYELPSPANSHSSGPTNFLNKNLNTSDMLPRSVPLHTQNMPEASSLALTVLLTDSLSNIFRDHNFDSCTLCVCNAGPKVVGNIRGADAHIYLLGFPSDKTQTPPTHSHQQHMTNAFPNQMACSLSQSAYGGMMSPPSSHYSNSYAQPFAIDEDSVRCSCGFSAVVNRRLAHESGLFFEDEIEITGVAEDPSERKKPSLLTYLIASSAIKAYTDPNIERDHQQHIDALPHDLIQLVREQCAFIPAASNSLYRVAYYVKSSNPTSNNSFLNTIHLLEYSDSNDMTKLALDQCKQFDTQNHSIPQPPNIHPHPHLNPTSHQMPCNDMGVMYDQPHHDCHQYFSPHHPMHNVNLSQPHGMNLPNQQTPPFPHQTHLPPQHHVQQSLHHNPQATHSAYEKLFEKMAVVHGWSFLRASGPQSNQDIVRVMKTLQPLLQKAIQKKCQPRLWEAPSAVKGPLTWRQFHRLAGRGTDDRCEPQPIPSIVVGHDKDWLSISPYAIHHWESLLLEPYSFTRDIAYIVVAPDCEIILNYVRIFFKELSAAYEMCKLGRHSPITKVLRDGILRVGKSSKSKIGSEPIDEWFSFLGENETTDMLKLYAQVCRQHLAPHLQQVPMDKTLFDPPPEIIDKPIPSPMPPPSTPDGCSNQSNVTEKGPTTPKNELDVEINKDTTTSNTAFATTEHSSEEESSESPSLVIYFVEPFSFGSVDADLHRLACLSLVRCFNIIVSSLPENMKNNVSLQIISLESIVELGKAKDANKRIDQMRMLSLNVFSQCRRILIHTNNVKSLTGFGTAAMAELFLKNKDDKNRAPYKLYTPPYILAPLREKIESADSFGKGAGDQASVLYLSYCLSEDQSWLLGVATDERGEIYETVNINVDIPNRRRRKRASARRIGLEKLMNFIVGVMSMSVRPWRLVVGRLGRIGHGELKGWSWLLSRKNLLRTSKHLKDICNQCALMYPSSVPCILSACLVSLEADTVLRLMPDQFTPDERFSQASVNSQLSTPHDVSCTHILVFPTSATTQSSQQAFQEQHITPELGDDELFSALNDDMTDGIDGVGDFSDIFNWTEGGLGGGQSPTGSPKRDDSDVGGSGMGGHGGPNGMGGAVGMGGVVGPGGNTMGGMVVGCVGGLGSMSGPDSSRASYNCMPCGPGSSGLDPMGGKYGSMDGNFVGNVMLAMPEEVGTLLQQPLALGYYVSTAPTGKMPRWFWSACPHLEGVSPAFLKNALHLHSPNIQQSSDELFQQSAVTSHPLDSTYTTDVLRYVLEGYNALSWLALDSNTRDRLSCLPVHIQVLIQLYHMTAALL